MEKFGKNSTKNDGMGEDFEIKDGKTHVEVKITQKNKGVKEIMNDRRTPTPIQVKHERPPLRPGNLRSVNASDMKDHEFEPWLEKMGYHTGYVYIEEGIRFLSYFESDKL